jgi:hypothetical protein
MRSRYFALSAALHPACQPGNSADACHPMSMKLPEFGLIPGCWVVAPVSVAVSITISIPVMIAVTVPILVTLASFYHEIGPAAVIDPDAPVIRTPAVAFLAGRFAALLH